jgi:leucyl-tRNA synthetase
MMTGENPRPAKSDDDAMKALHKTIKKIEEDIENYKFNTAIAQMMILLNTGEPIDADKNLEWKRAFVQLLHPFAPHMAEECWEVINTNSDSKESGLQKIYFATGNTAKIERAQKLFSKLNPDAVIEKYSEIIDVEETGKTSLECALQKLEVYK